MKKQYNKILPVAMAVASIAVPVAMTQTTSALEAWGPKDRETFTWEKPATYATFNSMTNNPTLGHESNFVRIRNYTDNGKFTDSVDLEVGKEYEVFIYYHNNGAANYGAAVMAENVRVRSTFPSKLTDGQTGAVRGFITATNTNPAEVWDTTYVKAHDTVFLRYVTNSAILYNGSKGEFSTNGAALNGDFLFGEDGHKVAYDSRYWGIIPGCNEYAGSVRYRIKVDQPAWQTTKTVSAEGMNKYGTSIVARPGDTLDFKLVYKNIGTTWQEGVSLYDTLPKGLDYIPGTTWAVSPDVPNGVTAPDKLFGQTGLAVGKYNTGQEAVITYKAKLSTDKSIFACGDTVIKNAAQSITQNGSQYTQVKITVRRACCTDGSDPKPDGTCPIKCPDGSEADENGVCPTKKCADGSDPKEDGTCPVKCPDGSEANEKGECPIKCDGDVEPDENGKCPAKCADGSEPDENGECPEKCADGSEPDENGECPKKCADGSEPDENGECPTKKCADGSEPDENGECPKKCADGSEPDKDGNCPTTPAELPNTGPTEIIMASMVIILMAAGGAYWFISWDQLHKTTANVSGKNTAADKPVTDKDADIVKDSIINNK